LNIKKEKIKIAKEIYLYEKIILFLENWKPGDEIPNYVTKTIGDFQLADNVDNLIIMIKSTIKTLQERTLDDYKLYLNQIIEKENIKFGSNNLILAPVGSGKTTFLSNLAKKQKGNSLLLVSNTTLKDSISPSDDRTKKIIGNRTYTTQNKNKFGEGNHETYVMSYAEFGKKVETNNQFIEKFSLVICDEIHSLSSYQQIDNSVLLAHAIKTLFAKYDKIQIFYLTATDEHINSLQKRQPEILNNVEKYDFRNRDDIKKYIHLASYKIKNLEQIRPHLKSRLEGFTYFGHKIYGFSRTIRELKKMEEIALSEGYKPLVLWSVNNEEYPMTKEQLEARSELLRTGYIPEPYNFLIINSAMQEGWNLKDKMVKLAIMNTTNETERIQALGRLRKDLEVLIYRTNDKITQDDLYVDLPIEFYNTPLTTKLKEKLCSKLDLRNNRGEVMKWTSIKRVLINQGYSISEGFVYLNGKKQRASTIYTETN